MTSLSHRLPAECASRYYHLGEQVLTDDPSGFCADCRDAARDAELAAEMDGWDPDYGHGDEW